VKRFVNFTDTAKVAEAYEGLSWSYFSKWPEATVHVRLFGAVSSNFWVIVSDKFVCKPEASDRSEPSISRSKGLNSGSGTNVGVKRS
jgi:hypothetical protein